jgi:hypothetical protein
MSSILDIGVLFVIMNLPLSPPQPKAMADPPAMLAEKETQYIYPVRILG